MRPSRPIAALLGATILVALACAGLWYLDGGRGLIVATPSMGTAAPVGTLVLTEPGTPVAAGDVVTYRPPVPGPARTVTHRVVAVDPDGGFRTRGDLNGAEDPWTAHPADLVGVAWAVLPGLGWLVRALPILLAGGALVRLGTRFLMPWRWGLPVRVLGYSLVGATAVGLLKPFVGAVVLGTAAGPDGSRITLVSTGLLPVRATAATGGYVDLTDGRAGTLVTRLPPGADGTTVTTGVHMPVWLWIVMTLVWLLPMFYGLYAAWRRPVDPPDPPRRDPWESGLSSARTAELYRVSELTALLDDGRAAPVRIRPPGPRRRGVRRTGFRRTSVRSTSVRSTGVRRTGPAATVAIGAAVAFVVSAVAPPTSSAFTAQVTGSPNTAGSAPFFGCVGALTTVATPYLVWPLDDTTVSTLSTARDASGDARTGTYTNAFTTSATNPCARDTARSVTLAPTALLPSSVATTNLTPASSSTVFSVAIWFRTTTTTGGRLIGWGNLRTLASTSDDRHLYMTDSGQVVFGVHPDSYRTITSPRSYNDGEWHLAVATLSGAGTALYLDGTRVATDTTTTTAEGGTGNLGFWRVGWDSLAGWTPRPTTDHWTGSLADAAVYTGTALTAAQVAQIYGAAS